MCCFLKWMNSIAALLLLWKSSAAADTTVLLTESNSLSCCGCRDDDGWHWKHQNAVWIIKNLPLSLFLSLSLYLSISLFLLGPLPCWNIQLVFDISFCAALITRQKHKGHQCFMGGALSMIKSWAAEQTEMRLIMDSQWRKARRQKKKKNKTGNFSLGSETFVCGNASFTGNNESALSVFLFQTLQVVSCFSLF